MDKIPDDIIIVHALRAFLLRAELFTFAAQLVDSLVKGLNPIAARNQTWAHSLKFMVQNFRYFYF